MSTTTSRSGLFKTAQTNLHLLVATDYRLVILAPPLSDSTSDVGSNNLTLPTRPFNPKSWSNDQLLLTQGQLDVDGMDRILNDMANSNTAAGPSSLTTNMFSKSVGFQIEEDDNDVDMGMGTPTPKQQHRRINRLAPSTRAEPKGRLFS